MEPMRRTLLWASTNPWLASHLPRRRFVQRAVRRFMPGETLEDALLEAKGVQSGGAKSIVTMLGENLERPEQTAEIVEELYLRVYSRFPTIDEQQAALTWFERPNTSARQATEDLLWALLNTPEFFLAN